MKRRSNLWTERNPADPPMESSPKADLDSLFAELLAGVDEEPSEEELAALTDNLRREGNSEAADLIDAKTED